MIKTFTQEELIRYVYREAPEKLHEQITKAICFDEELAGECASLLHTKQRIDKVSRTPSASSVAAILSYSRNYKGNV